MPRKIATVDRLAILNGGEAHVIDFSQWSPGVNEGKSGKFSNDASMIKVSSDWLV